MLKLRTSLRNSIPSKSNEIASPCSVFASTTASCLSPKVSNLLHLENQKFGAVDTLLNENITNFFSFGVSWKVCDDNATKLESWNNVLNVEPGAAGNEAGFRDHVLLYDSGLLFSELQSPVDVSFRLLPSPPYRPSCARSLNAMRSGKITISNIFILTPFPSSCSITPPL
jgi:hypothetical protein